MSGDERNKGDSPLEEVDLIQRSALRASSGRQTCSRSLIRRLEVLTASCTETRPLLTASPTVFFKNLARSFSVHAGLTASGQKYGVRTSAASARGSRGGTCR